jgi:thiamine transporter ThiT
MLRENHNNKKKNQCVSTTQHTIIIIIIIIIIVSFIQGIYTYIPETKYVPKGIQCCSYSVVTIHGAYIVSFIVESIVLLH